RADGSTAPGKLAEKMLPDASLSPPREAIVDGGVRTVFRRAILPTAATAQHMQDAADDPPIIRSFLAPHVGRQVRLNPMPLLVVEPEEVRSHSLLPFDSRESTTNSNRNQIIGFQP